MVSGEFGLPALAIDTFEHGFHLGQPAGLHVGEIPIDFLAETDGEVTGEDHFGEGAGVIDEVGYRLGALAADGAAEFLGGAALDARIDLLDGAGLSAQGLGETTGALLQ